MTDTQLYLAIGVPLLVNTTLVILVHANLSARINDMGVRINELRDTVNRRFDDQGRLFTEQLRRVEDVMDARLKHLEER